MILKSSAGIEWFKKKTSNFCRIFITFVKGWTPTRNWKYFLNVNLIQMTFRKKYSGKNKPDTHGQIINSYSFHSGLSNDKHWCLDLKKMHPGWKANKKNIEDKLTMRKANACFFKKMFIY